MALKPIAEVRAAIENARSLEEELVALHGADAAPSEYNPRTLFYRLIAEFACMADISQ